jgi:adenylate kinase
LRAAVKAQSPLGLRVESIMKSGGLVSDDLVNALIAERLLEDDATNGILLDGFPRTLGQATALDELLGDDGVSLVIDLEVPIDLVTERLSARRVCQECGAIYRDTDIEAISGTCEKCGGDVIQRDDDQPEAIRKRLETYERDTAPLLSFYAERGLLATVDGSLAPDEVTAQIEAVIAERGIA